MENIERLLEELHRQMVQAAYARGTIAVHPRILPDERNEFL